MSLVKTDIDAPMLDANYFRYITTSLTDTAYWTRTPSANNANYAFHMSFGSGTVKDGLKESARPVMLVRGTKPLASISEADWAVCKTTIAPSRPNSRYKVSAGEVTDSVTELIWQQCEAGLSGGNCNTGSASLYKYSEAQAQIAKMSSDPKSWRLPTKNELASLIENKCTNPAINTTVFPNTSLTTFWSSTTNKSYSTSQWAVNFYNGFVEVIPASQSLHLRLVRNP